MEKMQSQIFLEFIMSLKYEVKCIYFKVDVIYFKVDLILKEF